MSSSIFCSRFPKEIEYMTLEELKELRVKKLENYKRLRVMVKIMKCDNKNLQSIIKRKKEETQTPPASTLNYSNRQAQTTATGTFKSFKKIGNCARCKHYRLINTMDLMKDKDGINYYSCSYCNNRDRNWAKPNSSDPAKGKYFSS